MLQTPEKILAADEIYLLLVGALIEKRPLPPAGWCASKLDEEIRRATGEYEPDAYLRQKDALDTSLFYLIDFALRMPERVNLTENNSRVKEMCEDLAAEIEKITFEPNKVISKHGKLKVWLKAILAVQSCIIYTEETTRHIAQEDAAKRLCRIAQAKTNKLPAQKHNPNKWQSALAKTIFQKANAKTLDESSAQPSLF